MNRACAEVVLLQAAPGLTFPLAALTDLLADAVATMHGERVAILHLAEPGRASIARAAGSELVRHHRLEVAPGELPLGRIRAAIARLESDGEPLIFLDASPGFLSEMARTQATRIVRLAHQFDDQISPPSQTSLLQTIVLQDEKPRLRTRQSGWRESFSRGLGNALGLAGGGPEHARARSVPYCDPRLQGESCRIRIDGLGATAAAPFRMQPAELRETFARWARALTRRRVGVALGGAGSWGYAAAALMLELLEAGVPIDLVAGSSSGALLGAFYCAAGREGIERSIACGPAIGRAILLMTINSAPAEWLIDAELGNARLENLEIPLLPVVTNLGLLRPEVVVEGSAGLGVRASVSAPGLFAPTSINGVRCVDGAASDNVPAALVADAGASLTIAANPFPAGIPGSLRSDSRTRTSRKNRLLGVLDALDPIRRLQDARASLELAAHLAGAREANPRRLCYSPEPVEHPLRATFDYGAAARVIEHARRRDRRLRETVEAAVAAWNSLRAPLAISTSKPRNAEELHA